MCYGVLLNLEHDASYIGENMKIDKLTYKIDGLEADFMDEDQIELVQHLDALLKDWKITANTYRKAIEMLYESKNK